MSKRRIRIVLENRDAEDSPLILRNISECFPEDNLDIEITASPSRAKRDEILEMQTLDEAKQALDRKEEESFGKKREIVSKVEIKKQAINLKKIFTEEGIKVIIKEAVSFAMKAASQISMFKDD